MLAIPMALDLVATILLSVGLLVTTASVSQMLRGSGMLFAALFALTFLKRKLNWCPLEHSVCLAKVVHSVEASRHNTRRLRSYNCTVARRGSLSCSSQQPLPKRSVTAVTLLSQQHAACPDLEQHVHRLHYTGIALSFVGMAVVGAASLLSGQVSVPCAVRTQPIASVRSGFRVNCTRVY